MAASFDGLSLELKAMVFKHLSVADLCRMSEVNRSYRRLCSSDVFWEWRALKLGIGKAAEDQSWKWNYMAAVVGILHGRTLEEAGSAVRFQGDVWIGDPSEIFFAGKSNRDRWHHEFVPLLEMLNLEPGTGGGAGGAGDLVLTYRGIQCVIVPTRYGEGSYSVVRRGQLVGEVLANTGMIAIVPRSLVRILEQENGVTAKMASSEGVYLARGVEGKLFTSTDGDFYISGTSPSKATLVQLGDSLTALADILVATGGGWTEDGSDDDYESDVDATGEEQEEEEECWVPPRGELKVSDVDDLQYRSGLKDGLPAKRTLSFSSGEGEWLREVR